MTSSLIEKSVEIDASLSKVWAVFTDPSVTRQMGGEYVSDWKAGSSFGWQGMDGTMLTHGTILQIEPERRLQHNLFAASTTAVTSVITYDFQANGTGTTLRAREEFTNALSDEDYADASAGWDAALQAVKELAEK